MSDLPNVQGATIDAIIDHASRATLPFQRAHREEQHATAFWFNELVETTDEGEAIRQYLVTAGGPTRFEIAEFTLRPDLCDPAMSAEKLMMVDFAAGWTHLEDLGVAVMPTAGLHAHGARKGWSWTTDEITDGMAAKEEDIAVLGAEPVAAYLLGHEVGAETGARDLVVVVGAVTRTESGGVRWVGDVPQGCVGAPVFIGAQLGGDSFKLVCAGVVLAGDGHHPIATFDRVRTALRALAPAAVSVPETDGPNPQEPELKRRWWQRRG
ncbi:hypothetical protein [Streptomyces sp. NBC_01198]|uniref:hypothetical protein n=1 Tax=Streptomyces sp. NBC_01198 TaxID=2903769 RepID=UPI002E0D80CB|nr:hypothetical protein OG702_00065 [Streptomyces sp. NBC_01198]WSR66428.1 hypothetical protein OG702_35295 [Streptomyces sp. NBC_01198]